LAIHFVGNCGGSGRTSKKIEDDIAFLGGYFNDLFN